MITRTMGPQPTSLPSNLNGHVEEAVLLGRRNVVGSVNATSLASLVRSLRVGSPTLRRGLQAYWLRCNDQGLEIRGPKYDEGFESDDTESTRSGGETEERAGESSSSGISDIDELISDNSLVRLSPLRELYSVRDIVFCHGDPTFPRIVVWVVNTTKRRQPGSYLEALVFECKNETSVKQLCMNYHDISRRYKLEQYNNKRKDNNNITTLIRPKYLNDIHQNNNIKSSFTREMECVTDFIDSNFENGQVLGRRRERILRQREPPSLLILPHQQQQQIESELHKKWSPVQEKKSDEPPKRPERRRYLRKNKNQTSQDDSNILRGQFVRVNVIEPSSLQQQSSVLLKPQFTWMYGIPDLVQQQKRSRCRSVSPNMSRRIPMPHRYGIEQHQQLISSNRLVQGISQKLRDLTPINSSTLKHPKKYDNISQQQFTTLKPVIKKSNKRYDDQPKKVTFSAYATVQVVD